MDSVVDIIIPAYNEAPCIRRVVEPLQGLARRVVVVDNGSTDATAEEARQGGATVIHEPHRGYGRACLTGLAYLSADPPDVVAFMDGDLADDPADFPALLHEVLAGADLVIGSRVTGESERGALSPHQEFGNWLATRLIQGLYGVSFTDLGPFRMVRWSALRRIEMRDEDFGWTVEMQVRAAKLGLRCAEVPVRYRRRVGVSKISGTLRGSVMAGTIILSTIARERVRRG